MSPRSEHVKTTIIIRLAAQTFYNIFSRFHRMTACDGWTSRRRGGFSTAMTRCALAGRASPLYTRAAAEAAYDRELEMSRY